MTNDAWVRVPATSANLGPGFDALGLALAMYDDVRAERTEGAGLHVEVVGVGSGSLPLDDRHLVVRAMTATFAALGQRRPGLSLRCENRVPHGKGLGSSAAAAVSGALLARQLADDGPGQLDDGDVLALASTLEGHPDNAAAALQGGLTVAWQEGDVGGRPRAVRLEPAASLVAALLVPAATLATERARRLLPATIPHRDAVHAAGRAALLVHALTREPGLLLEATDDRLHQPYRAPAMPGTAELVARLRSDGLAAVVSGAGPSVLVLGVALDEAGLARHAGPGWTVRVLDIDRDGARVSGTPIVDESADGPND